MAAQNDSFSAKYNKNYQDRFIELAEMENSDLEINSQIVSGVKYGLLRRRQGYYLFNGERIDGIDNNLQLFNYFKNPKNQEDYLKLLDLLKDGR